MYIYIYYIFIYYIYIYISSVHDSMTCNAKVLPKHVPQAPTSLCHNWKMLRSEAVPGTRFT